MKRVICVMQEPYQQQKKTENFEIESYGTIRQFGQTLGFSEAASL